MSVHVSRSIGFGTATKSWAASLAVHLAMVAVLVGWQGPPPKSPWLHSHFGQTSLLLSAADPTPGVPDAPDSLAEPIALVVEQTQLPQSQPVPSVEPVQEVDTSAVEPQVQLAEIRRDNPLLLLPPQAALEPIEQPQFDEPKMPPPGDQTSTASLPAPGRIGNDQPSEPEFESNPPILYPPAAVRDGVEGTVLLRIRIGTRGEVVNVELVKSSGSAVLDNAAIDGVRTWHGRPARIAGRAIETSALLPVVFRLH